MTKTITSQMARDLDGHTIYVDDLRFEFSTYYITINGIKEVEYFIIDCYDEFDDWQHDYSEQFDINIPMSISENPWLQFI